MGEENANRLSVTSWVQIATSILTMLASLGLWLVRTASTPSIEATEIHGQINEINKELVALQLKNERLEIIIQNLEDREHRK